MTITLAGIPIEDAIAEWLTTTEFNSSGIYIPSEELREWCHGSLSFFKLSMESLFKVSTIDEISFVHIGTYHCTFRQMIESGQWNLLLGSLDQNPNYQHGPEDINGSLELQADILKRFLAFCWSREYIGDHFLSWIWTQDEFEKAARLKDAYVVRRVGRA